MKSGTISIPSGGEIFDVIGAQPASSVVGYTQILALIQTYKWR